MTHSTSSALRCVILDQQTSRLWPTARVKAVVLEASLCQCFGGKRRLEPLVVALVAKGCLCFGDLVGLTRQQLFDGTPRVFKVRSGFIRELEARGFAFSTVGHPVPQWRRRVA